MVQRKSYELITKVTAVGSRKRRISFPLVDFSVQSTENHDVIHRASVRAAANNSLQKIHSSEPVLDNTVIVYGTGDLSRALVTRLVKKGFRAVVASRNPEKHRFQIERIGGEVASYKSATQQGEIVILAVPFEAFNSLPADLLENKIVVDVSNRPLNYKQNGPSLACQLQETLPESKVVKAFNTLSAYGLQSNLPQGNTEVPICSDFDDAKEKVKELIRGLGFSYDDRGKLSSSKEIEDIPLAFFPEWRLAGKLALGLYIFAFLYMLFVIQLCPNIDNNDYWDWTLFTLIPLYTVQTAFALSAITMLSLCYLPGVIAAYIQLYRQTKYSDFPAWLDSWLKSRKQIGLLTQAFASTHFVLAVLSRIVSGIPGEWRDVVFLMFGVFTLVQMTILGITSLPSVSSSLSWREFSFIHRYLGWWCLTCAVLHLIFRKWSQLITSNQHCIVIPDPGQVFIILPLLTILLKLVLLLPCVYIRIQKIRRGFEGTSRKSTSTITA